MVERVFRLANVHNDDRNRIYDRLLMLPKIARINDIFSFGYMFRCACFTFSVSRSHCNGKLNMLLFKQANFATTHKYLIRCIRTVSLTFRWKREIFKISFGLLLYLLIYLYFCVGSK